MVAIVSGNSLGLTLTSLATLGSRGSFGSAVSGRAGEQAYVNVATGNLVIQDRDELLLGRGPDASALRTYNSQGLLSDDNGDNWGIGIANARVRLTGTLLAAGSTLVRTGPDGAEAVYAFDAVSGGYVSTSGSGAYDRITYDATSTRFVWTDGDTGVIETYQATAPGRLLSTTDTNNNTLSFTYSANGLLASARTASGETTYFDYSGTKLTQVRSVVQGSAGSQTVTRVRYAYDSSNRLSAVTLDLSPEDNSISDGKVYTTTYTYDGSSKRVATVTQTDGTSLSFTYVQIGGDYRVATVMDGLGQITRFSYDPSTRKTSVTDSLGLVWSYEYDTAGQLTQVTSPIISGVAATTSYVYSPQGDLLSVTDGEGRVVTMAYDANGNQVLQRDAAGNTVGKTYDNRNQLVTETVYLLPDSDGDGPLQPAQPLTTRFVYDAAGKNLLRFVLSPEGRVTEYRYASSGERQAVIEYTSALYSTAGLAQTATPTEAAVSSWSVSQALAKTVRTDMAYDYRGQLQSLTTYAKVDANGIGITDGTQSVTQYVYDPAGQLIKTVSPKSGVTLYVYDGLGRVVSTSNGLGEITLNQYDDINNRTTVVLSNGLSSISTYDRAGRLVSLNQTDAAATSFGVTQYFYDAANKLRMTQDPTGVRKWLLYDEVGRQSATIDGNGSLVEYVYDKTGQLIQTIAFATAVNVAQLVDAQGKPVDVNLSSVRPALNTADRKHWRIYDEAGRLVKTIDGIGAVTEMRYDGASRLVSTIRYATAVSIGSLGANPAPSAIAPTANSADRVTRNLFDSDGLLRGILDGEGYLTEFRYDAAGRQIEKIEYANVSPSSARPAGTLAQLTPATHANDIRSITFLNARGQVIGVLDGEGYLTESSYDANGNLVKTQRYATKVSGSISSTQELATFRPTGSVEDQVQLQSFDALNRVVQQTDSKGTTTQLDYDEVGNLIRTTLAVGTTEVRVRTSRFDLQGRLIGELSAEGAALLTGTQTQSEIDAVWVQYGVSYSYDAAGRRISLTDAQGNKTFFFYNADSNLTHTVNALGEVEERQYSTLGQLTTVINYGTRIATGNLTGGIADSTLLTTLAGVRSSTLDSKTSFTYTKTGAVATETDAAGFVTSHGYSALGVESSRTQKIDATRTVAQQFSYDKRGLLISSRTDSSGINALQTRQYDAFGRMVRFVDSNGNIKTQSFDRLGRSVAVRDPLSGLQTTSYDAFDRVLTEVDALGNKTTYSYSTANRTVTVTTPEGVSVVTTQTRHGQTQSVKDGRGNTTTYTYDRDGNLKKSATSLNQNSSVYDKSNRLIETTDANGRKTAYTYDAANRLLTRTVDSASLKLVTAYQYDAKGQQVSVTDPAGVVTQLQFDLKGQVVKKTVDPTGLNLATTFTYDGRGLQLTVTSPGGSVIRYVYDLMGRRIEERIDPDGLNLSKVYSYDKNGNVLSVTDANGNLTRYVYDANDRLVFTLDALGNLKQNIYDAEGRVTRVVAYAVPISLTDLASTPTLADVQSRVQVTPSLDVAESRLYDKDGRQTWAVDATGAAVKFTYDANGNVIDRIAYAKRIDLSAWNGTTAPVPIVDAADQRLRTVYDTLNRATYSINGIGAVTWQKYDGNGNVVDRINYAGTVPVGTAATSTALAAAVALIANGARDARVRQQFDGANRSTWSADGTGAVTRWVYDKNGNITHKVEYANTVAVSATPSTVVTSAADRVTAYAYDKANRQVFQIDALGGVVRSNYDANGNVVQQIAYAKPVTAPAVSTTPTIAALTASVILDAANDRVTRVAYDAANRKSFTVDAQGAVTERRYDPASNLTATRRYAAAIDTTGLAVVAKPADIAARVVVDDAVDRVASSAFDAGGRKIYDVDALGYVTESRYDGVGRITSTTAYSLTIPAMAERSLGGIAAAVVVTTAKDRNQSFNYDSAGNLISTTDALGQSESYTYDGLGRKLTFTNKLGAKWTYLYDSAGRLTSETAPPVAVTSVSGVDTLKLVVDEAKSFASQAITTQLQYDAMGNLLSRTEAAGLAGQRTTSYEYDAVGRQIRIIYPPVGVYSAALDNLASNGAAGLATRVEVSSTQLFTQTSYDSFGNAVMNRDVAGNLSFKTYDKLGHVAYDVDALGFVTGYTRNSFGQVTRLARYAVATSLSSSSTPLSGVQVSSVINATGVDHGADRTILTEYDRLGRILLVTEPQTYVYEVNSSGVATSGFAGKKTRNAYNVFGDLISVSALKSATTNTWTTTVNYFDRSGQNTAAVDALGYLTTRQYDGAGNLTSSTEFATAIGGWNAASAPSGSPTAATSASDRTTTYVYDANNRRTQENRLNVEYSSQSNGTSTRGTLTTRYAYDAVGNVVTTTDAAGLVTYTAYDALGRIRAVTAPSRSVSGSTVAPLTVFRRDAYGNVVATIEYAAGASAADRTRPAATGANDRTSLSAYDAHGHTIQTTDATGASVYSSYNAQGNLAKEWQNVQGNDGVNRTLFKAYEYDKLGRVTHLRDPASTTVLRGGLQLNTTSSSVVADESGDKTLSGTNTVKLTWSGLIDAGGGLVRVQVDYQTKSTLTWIGNSESGQLTSTGVASHSAVRTQEATASAVAGGLTMSWNDNNVTDGGIESVTYLRVWQKDGSGNWVMKWDGTAAQASGSGVATVSQQAAGVTDTASEYNAFGEVVVRGVNGGRQEYFDYDNAGRLWRTNSGDGIDKAMLYDVQGRHTEEIRSAGSVNIKAYATADSLTAASGLRRTDMIYDDLGRVVQTLLPSRQDSQGGVSVQPIRVLPTISSSTPVFNESAVSSWNGTNSIQLAWNSLAALGGGDVKVVVDYVTQSYSTANYVAGTDESGQAVDENGNPVVVVGGGSSPTVTQHPGVGRSLTRLYSSSDASAGVTISWQDGAGGVGGLGGVNRVQIYKKDVDGQWRLVIDRNTYGNSGNEIQVAAPADPQTRLVLQLRPAGSTGDTGWSDASLVDFGNVLRYDASGLAAGNYEYRVRTTTSDGVTRITATGTVGLSGLALSAINSPLNFGPAGEGVYAWQSPGSGVNQAFRYRPAGSTGAWSSVTVNARSNGYDGVDLRFLGAGNYQYELIWSRAGEAAPYAHATGQVGVVAAVPPQYVPPVNLPHVGGVWMGWSNTGGSYDESGNVVGGRWTNVIQWPQPASGTQVVFRYRVGNGGWSTLPVSTRGTATAVNESGQPINESGQSIGVQNVDVSGLGPNTYEIQVLFTAPGSGSPTAQAIGNYTVYNRGPGRWENRTVAVQRTRTVTPPSPNNYITGYDESGQPTYGWPVIVGYDGNFNPLYGQGYYYDGRTGKVAVYSYNENYTAYENQQYWVEGTIPSPSFNLTTPPYTAGYTIPGRPPQYSGSVSTAANSAALSQNASVGAVLTQTRGLNDGSRTLRPSVFKEFDRWGNVVSLTDPRNTGWKTTYRYNANNQLVEERKPDVNGAQTSSSPITKVFYDQLGRQVAVMDARGYTNGQVYDAGGNLTEERHADGGVVKSAYNVFGDKIKVTDAMGKVTDYGFDKAGRMTRAMHEVVGVYSVNNNMTLASRGFNTFQETYGYDAAGRMLWTSNESGETTRYTYDARGNIVQTQLPGGQVSRMVFDAQGRKIADVDANGMSATWTYDYFGLLVGHTDLGGAKFTYTYDSARQLTKQTSTRGQSISHTYDDAGQLVRSVDTSVKQETLYSYDASGRKVREITRSTVNGAVYQDNHLAYDAQGQLRDISDGRVHITIDYDKVGNRTRITTSVINSADQNMASDRYFAYDSMNRQTLVDGVNAAGAINANQGHRITYDKNGNRLSDTTWGKRVTAAQQQTGTTTTNVWGESGIDENGLPVYGWTESSTPIYKTVYNTTDGEVTETYTYDGLNRLQTTKRDNVLIDTRYYDGGSRVVQSGPNGSLNPEYAAAMNNGGIGNGSETRINRYDENGRLLAQRVLKSDNGAKYDLTYNQYDAAGNLLQYSLINRDGASYTNTFTTALARYEGYKESTVSGTSTKFRSGTTTNQYDANGHLVGITDSTKAESNRTFVNDAQGHALMVNQGGRIQRQLVVNGEVLGRYGEALDANANNGSFIQIADFNFGYQPISGSYPSASPGVYSVLTGDTLKSIAQGAYGDSKLWYRIAEANGLSGDADLRVGQALTIPAGVGTIHNDSSVFKPYDPTKITGDTTPNLPVPSSGGGCGGMGMVIVAVVAVVAAVMTQYYYLAPQAVGAASAGAAAGGSAAAAGGAVAATTATTSQLITAGALAGAAGSVAGQVAGNILGVQSGFDWRGVALGALSGAVGGGMSSLATGNGLLSGTGLGVTVARAAVGNAFTQGIGIVTGLQSSFNWRGVAASAAGSGAGWQIGEQLGLQAQGMTVSSMGLGEKLLKSTLAGLGAGTVTAIARGGRVAVQQVATDAFGNALGQGLAQAMGQRAVTAGGGDSLDALLALNDNFSGADVSRAGSGLGGQLGGSGLGVMPSNSTLSDWSQGIDQGVTQAAAVTTASSTGTGAYGGPAVGSSLDDAEIASMRSENFSRINALAAQSATEMGVSSGVASSGFDAQGRYVVEIYGYEKTGSMAGSVQLDPVQDFQLINDQKVAAGTYDRFSEIGNAMTDGRYGDAWSHLSFSASEQARTTATQRLYPQPSAEAQRLSAMMASPAGAIAWGAAGLAGASADTQDAILQTVAAVGQVAGAATGVYKQTLTAQAPSPMTAAARSRAQGATPLASSTGSRPDDFLVANHGDMPTPRPGQNSHHGVMSKWMEANYPGYKPDLAPAVLLPVENHRATYGVYNRWRAETSRQMGVFDWAKVPESSMRVLSNQMFDAAKVPDASRQQYWNRYEAMKGALEK